MIDHLWGRGLRGFATKSGLIAVACALSFALAGVSCADKMAVNRVEASTTPKKPVQVQVTKVQLKEVRRTVESVGSLFPYDEVTVSSEVDGPVQEVLVDVGDPVTAGQAIVKISPVEFRLALEEQQAALRQALARLGLPDEEDELRDVREAAEVKKAAADLGDAEVKYNRAKALFDGGLMPRETYDEADSRYKSAKAAYDLAVQGVENLRAQVSQYRVQMALAQKKLNDCVIRAPFSGQVRDRMVSVGQYLKVQTPVINIVNTDPLRVRLKVPERMSGWIQNGQEVTISVEAYPDKDFTGKVWRMNPTVDQQTRAFEVEALVTNHDGLLKPGFFVKAGIPSGRVDKTLLIPQTALSYAYGIYKAFVVDENVLVEKDVRIGDHPNQEVEILDGLNEGEIVALPPKGAELRDREAVEIIPQ